MATQAHGAATEPRGREAARGVTFDLERQSSSESVETVQTSAGTKSESLIEEDKRIVIDMKE